MRDALGCGAVIVGMAALALAVYCAFVMFLYSGQCDRLTMEHRWEPLGGCFVNTEDAGWVPIDNLVVVR